MKNITFYVPTLNSASTIEECIMSIKEQGISIKKIFVVDDGSEDKTLRILEKLGVNVIEKDKKGLSSSRNIALKHCKTKYIAFVDSDVVLQRNWLKNIMGNLDDIKTVGVGGRLQEKHSTKLADKWRKNHLKQQWGSKKKSPDFLFGSNVVFKSKAVLIAGGFNEDFKTNYEDVDLCYRLKENGYNLIYEPRALATHLKKDDFLSVLQAARRWSFFSYPVPNTFSSLMLRLFIYNPYWALNHLLKDFLRLRFLQLFLTLSSLFYFEYSDVRYYFTK